MLKDLKVTSWNINGVRSLKSSMKSILDNFDADIICLQEIKATKDTIEYENAVIDGYNSYFSFCQTKPGYSGVAIYCRDPITPIGMEEGLIHFIKKLNVSLKTDDDICENLQISIDDLKALEAEGRALCGEFLIKDCECGISAPNHSLWIINVYCPMAEPDNAERLHYKKNFNKLVQLTMSSIINKKCHLVLVGDLNIVHKPIDIAETVPKEVFLSNFNRQWLDSLLTESQRYVEIDEYRTEKSKIDDIILIDTFRYLHPLDEGCYSCWNTKIGGRQTNFGTRIDYIFCDAPMMVSEKIKKSELLSEVYGSDHCPVSTTFGRLELISSTCLPSLCSTNLSQFRNQPKITSFISRTQKSNKRPYDFIQKENHLDISNKQLKLDVTQSVSLVNLDASNKWKNILKGPPKAPLCTGHKIPCVNRTVIKDTVNKGKRFWVCSKPNGLPGHPESRCNHFEWAKQ